jgi:hypothetical protein
MRRPLATAFLVVTLAPALAVAGDAARLSARGVWVADRDGKPIPPGSFKRGLQPSGLLVRGGELWAIGDQRSEYPGHLFRIDPRTGRLIGLPIALELPAETPGEDEEFAAYRKIPNSDFEGVTIHPRDPDLLFAVTEDKVPWIAEIRLERDPGGGQTAPGDKPREEATRARLVRLTRIIFPPDAAAWRDDPNFRFEGCALSDDATTLFLAFERTRDDLPRIYRVALAAARAGKAVNLEAVPVAFAKVPRRADKQAARLNLNDLFCLRHQGKALAVAIARDQERLLLIDLDRGEVTRIIDLELLDPGGRAIHWVSPEGLAADVERDRLWIINDPDSVERNYRARDEAAASGPFADYSPLLFELKLSEVLGEPRPGTGE